MSVKMDEYFWIAVVGGFAGFWYAFGIGANDVANAFGSTVASKSLTLKQAVMVAAVFEFCGSYFLGASVTSTIRSKIFNIKLYDDEPEIVMLGMMTSLIVATFMLLSATALSLPVSTTHTIVGSITGFSIAAKGFDSIEWDVFQKIIISWLASPLVSGAIAFAFFASLRIFVLRSEHAFTRSINTFPLVLFIGIGIDLFYVLYKGLSNIQVIADLELKVVLPISFGVGAFCGLVWLVVLGPIIKKRIERNVAANVVEQEVGEEVQKVDVEKGEDEEIDVDADAPEEAAAPLTKGGTTEAAVVKEEVDAPEAVESKSMLQRFGDNTYNQDLKAQSLHESKRAAELWADFEEFDPHAEELFTYIQVFTACLNAFAHGANDVANAIAPISAIIYIYQTGELSSKSPVQKWILAYGGIGIVFGLLLYGYKIMKALGFKVTPLSPSRGACAELAASLFVVTASFVAIPVSSTQCITGAVAGVGLAGGIKNVQWLFLLQICTGWVAIFFVAIILSAGLFSFLAFSPSLSPPLGYNATAWPY
jgi:solute carrier family 20 (sodium-dependent phosphate transporter)